MEILVGFMVFYLVYRELQSMRTNLFEAVLVAMLAGIIASTIVETVLAQVIIGIKTVPIVVWFVLIGGALIVFILSKRDLNRLP